MTGGVVLAPAGDLITLIVALETLTLPLYVAGRAAPAQPAPRRDGGGHVLRRVSVVATAVTLLGAALLYAATGAVHLGPLRGGAGRAGGRRRGRAGAARRAVAVVLVLAGLAFKVAAVPFHAWAPATYDGAPLPVAAYLSTASKLGGVVALLSWRWSRCAPWLDVAGPVLAALAVLTMTVGNLVALRQRRMVRLLAWSSVAQAGYILAPLGAFAAGRRPDAERRWRSPWPPRWRTPSSTSCWSSPRSRAVVALRGARRRRRDRRTTAARPGGGRGSARRWCSRWSGWPACRPGLAGLFAKVDGGPVAAGRRRGLARPGGRAQRGDRPGLLRAGRRGALRARRRRGAPAPVQPAAPPPPPSRPARPWPGRTRAVARRWRGDRRRAGGAVAPRWCSTPRSLIGFAAPR